MELTRSRKPSTPENREEVEPTDILQLEDSLIATEDVPALAAKGELRNLGYMPDESLLFGKAVSPVVLSINSYSEIQLIPSSHLHQHRH